MLCEINNRPGVSLFRRRSTTFIGPLRKLAPCAVVLFVLTSLADAQSVQAIDPGAQLASMMCRNPAEEATNERLLTNNPQLVNVSLWNTLLNCASAQKSPADAIQIYRLTVRVSDLLKRPDLAANTYYRIGRTYSAMNDFENAISAYETSRRLFEQAGIESKLISVLADLAASCFTTEDYQKARRYSEQSLAIADQIKSSPSKESVSSIEYGRARSLHTLGQIDLRDGNHEQAIKNLGRALALYESLKNTDAAYNTPISAVFADLGKVYSQMGEYGRAFSYMNRALKISKSSGGQKALAEILYSLGSLLLEQEDYAAAQTYFDQSLAIYQSQRNEREEVRVLLSLAVIKQRQGQHNAALRLFEQSMEGAKSTRLVDVQIAAGEGLAIVFSTKRDFGNALKAITESLELARRVNAKPREVELLWRMAQIHYAMQNHRESASLAEEAARLARSRGLPKLTYLATAALGEAHAADNKVDLAITTLKDAISQLEALRNKVVGRQESLQLFFENKVGPYRTLVKLLTKQGQNFEALLYAERAKGRVLLEAVRSNKVDLKDALTDAERIEAERLINNISAISEQIQAKSDSESTSQLNKQMAAARSELASFQERLAAAHPDLQVRAGAARPLTHADLNTLTPATDFAYLEYVLTGDDVGLFILKRNGLTTDHDLKYINLPVNANELRQKVNEFHSRLAERHPSHNALGRELYRLLIEPAANELQNIQTVCIIPDEFLWTLPFQALRTTRGNYFIEEYSLYYAPSLSVLKEMSLRRQQQSNEESLIAFGNPVIERSKEVKQNFHPLPEAEAEVAAVATALRTSTKKIFVGRQAEEKTFKTLAPQYATIHLATHGVLDNRDPLNSHLLLTKTNGDPENDGLLQAREIINMRLNADLAVLSACETGNGRISPGEGVVGMSWAFMVAGARSVVVSQWRVNSASTSQLMKSFYQALAGQNNPNSRNKSQALREASLHLLKDRRYRHPFYWSGFVLVSSNH